MLHIRDGLIVANVDHRAKRDSSFEDSESAIPKTGKIENILPKSGMLLAPENHHAKHHNSPRNHHNFTTKNHHEKHTFPATHLKNSSKKRPKSTRAARQKKSEDLHQILRKIAHSQHMEVLQPGLQHIHQAIFPLGSVGLRKNPVSSTKSFVLLIIPSIISPS